ncbi:MAG: DEAD/DEAH box helicase [Gammaproteobacteria bacterium]|nr:DEAD/DEAH box helicase [Gammaproteobacteria bacterium]MCP5136442.1 DEAD/DEAH box helicase [Gammaproteobacteria bacterium]
MTFHPAITNWFQRRFGQPTEAQARAWPNITAGRHTLVAAPTGSGKTLAAFLAAIDELVRESIAAPLPDAVQVLYVSPLKALSNDIRNNLEGPLAEIAEELAAQGQLYGHGGNHDIRIAVRTGDTPAYEREKMRRQPPHILVTTPESLYILLTSESGRAMLRTVRTLIVDEIHALAPNKRGAHLSLSIERLAALVEKPFTRVGLSATQKPIEEVARFLVGNRDESCEIIDGGHTRDRDLALELPSSPLEAVMSAEVWTEIYDKLTKFTEDHRTTLVFVNTRRYAERVARHLSERLGEDAVAAHHGSLSREHRLDAEQRLKSGRLRIMVATASLELGIDIGDVELVCQLGSPKAIAAFLQRVGRSGHAVTGTPKGRLFPLSRDDLVECAALLDAVGRGELDRLEIPQAPLDVLAQQIVAEVASEEWGETELFDTFRRARPYHDLTREQFDAIVRMLAEGSSTRRGRRSAWLHHDGVNHRLRARKGARLTAITNGGAIPDLFDYDVRLLPENLFVGTLNEDFAFESLPGDIFQLGNTSYRVERVQMGTVYVADAHGQPPNIPFWFGEAPGRSNELSAAVSRLREEADRLLAKSDAGAYPLALIHDYQQRLPESAARQLAEYLASARASLGVLPTQNTLVLERFFDEAGDMHLVVHSPFGSRMNRAWGLALRKRFCRSFNFELQAAALEDTIVLSLSSTHSFELEEVSRYLNSTSVRALLIQAMFDAPMFESRWRWNATTALAVRRFRNGKRVPPQLQRMDAEDLVAVAFPDQLACLENIQGDREIPDHPLVRQTIADCLHEAMDIEALEAFLARLESGAITVVARDLPEPSMLAREVLSARPYAFLDNAPAEERRTQMVNARRFVDPQSAADVAELDPAAIARVQEEAWPEPRDPDELHDALMLSGGLRPQAAWTAWYEALHADGRASELGPLWVATERRAQVEAAYAGDGDALRELVRGHLEISGPITAQELTERLRVPVGDIGIALVQLEGEGFVFRGRFRAADGRSRLKPLLQQRDDDTPPVGAASAASGTQGGAEEWCERRLLARIHRYTVNKLRAEIEPVSPADMLRFLLDWQGLNGSEREGPEALALVLDQLEGIEAPAASWEADLLPARLKKYDSSWLDELCREGRIVWARLSPAKGKSGPIRSSPIALLPRRRLRLWKTQHSDESTLSAISARLLGALRDGGAAFFEDLVDDSGLLPTQAEEALGELVAQGLVSADSFSGLRALITPAQKRGAPIPSERRRGRSVSDAGRWSPLRVFADDNDRVEEIAHALLRRHGVVFRRVIERDLDRLPAWRELLYVYRRMEARGEIRGGRFVAGFAGEQYALPEAVKALRAARNAERKGTLVSISAADPLNLTGVLLPGARVPAQAGNRILFRDGVPIAWFVAGEEYFVEEPDTATRWRLHQALMNTPNRAAPKPRKPGKPPRWLA